MGWFFTRETDEMPRTLFFLASWCDGSLKWFSALLFLIVSFHLFCFVSFCASCSCFLLSLLLFLKKEVLFSYLCQRLTLKTIVVIVALLPGEELLFDISTSEARGLKPHHVPCDNLIFRTLLNSTASVGLSSNLYGWSTHAPALCT